MGAEATNERFRLAVDAAPNAMIMTDQGGRIVLANAQTEKLFGYARTELSGLPIERLVPQRFRAEHAAFRAEFLRAPRTRLMGTGRDLYGLRKDGTEVPVEIGLNPIRTPEGDFVLAAIVDMTERKRSQEALAEKYQEAEAFVYIVSHDLRGPLLNLQGFSKELELSCGTVKSKLGEIDVPEAIARDLRTILDEDVPRALRYITASADKLERLVDALLELSRSGRHQYRFEQVNMRELVTATLDSLRRAIDRADAQITLYDLPDAWGDPTSLGQVFANLVGNALNYLDPARTGLIEIGGEPRPHFNHYWVRDNGVGIPETAKKHLFQAFQRFHPHMAKGEGVGLTIIKRIVARHGGEVWADSEENVGTTFHVSLPAGPRDPEADRCPEPDAPRG